MSRNIKNFRTKIVRVISQQFQAGRLQKGRRLTTTGALFLVSFLLQNCGDDAPTTMQTVAPQVNLPPVITSLNAVPDTIDLTDSSTQNDTALVTCLASDPEGDSLNFEFNVRNGGQIGVEPNMIRLIVIVEQAAVTCAVTDTAGNRVSETIMVRAIRDSSSFSNCPSIQSMSTDKDTERVGESATISVVITNPDSLNFQVDWSSSFPKHSRFVVTSDPTVVKWHSEAIGQFFLTCAINSGIVCNDFKRLSIIVDDGS